MKFLGDEGPRNSVSPAWTWHQLFHHLKRFFCSIFFVDVGVNLHSMLIHLHPREITRQRYLLRKSERWRNPTTCGQPHDKTCQHLLASFITTSSAAKLANRGGRRWRQAVTVARYCHRELSATAGGWRSPPPPPSANSAVGGEGAGLGTVGVRWVNSGTDFPFCPQLEEKDNWRSCIG